jgi:hypothetical protein
MINSFINKNKFLEPNKIVFLGRSNKTIIYNIIVIYINFFADNL